MQVEIPGGTAELRDRLSVGNRSKIKAISADVFQTLKEKYPEEIVIGKPMDTAKLRADGELATANDDFGIRAVLTFVESWDLECALPATFEEWEDFDDTDIFDALAGICVPLAYASIAPKVKVSPETVRDAESPTVPSSGSNGRGQAASTRTTSRRPGSRTSTRSTGSARSSR